MGSNIKQGRRCVIDAGRRISVRAIFFALTLVCFSQTISAQMTWGEEYAKRLRAAETVGPLSDSLMGDSVSLFNGGLSFSATDVSVPGNDGLSVAFPRRVDPTSPLDGNLPGMPGWFLDLPHLTGIYSADASGSGYWSPSARCTGSPIPDGIGSFLPVDFWSGTRLSLPGGGGGDLLIPDGNPKLQLPQTGQTFTRVTKDRWFFSCLPSLQSGHPGEGFVGLAPDGTKYYFDWLTTTTYPGIQQRIGVNMVPLNRVRVRIYPTKIEDRFGNVVHYTWSGSRLTRIHSQTEAAREITIAYTANTTTITAGTRQWLYSGSQVTNPDGSKWTYASTVPPWMMYSNNIDFNGQTVMDRYPCGAMRVLLPDIYTVTITHPSGAVGVFSLTAKRHVRSGVPLACEGDEANPDARFNEVPIRSDSYALIKKVLSGSGMTTQVWDYANGSVTRPDGVVVKNTFGKSYQLNEGQLLSVETLSGGVQVELVNNTYVSEAEAANAPFPDYAGVDPRSMIDPGHDNWSVAGIRPSKLSSTLRHALTYTNQVNAFDSFARPIDVTRSNSSGTSKTELTQYVDNTNKWVLGQVGSVADVATGLIEQSNSYDPATANLLTKSSFGVLQESYTYNADGTLATVKDGKNNTYTLASWKRGIPQLITAPNLTTQSGVVNDAGWLSSVTNQRGYTTGYTYDLMGRLASITPPTGDTVAWAGTTLSFTPLTTAIYGVPAGGWKHSISRGNYRKETYLDALYRPLVVREYDNANASGTQRFSLKSYDTLNREVFSAYPGISSGLTVGSRTEYDALGRVTASKADSELGVLTTTTEYLSGGGIKVTGPDGTSTTRTFRSLDTPSYEQMVQEVGPGGVTTSISRDGFGKPLTITRSGSDGLNISKQFAYDANQRLCMRTEPETGTSIIDYDAAGNVLWAANGQAVANPAVCDRPVAVAGAKINYTYDALNRVTKTDVPSTTLDPTLTYLADGTVNTLVNGTATWAYTYNKLGKPVTETLTLGSRVNTITHAYDTLANETSLTYPSGTSVAYLPNALGQPTQAGSYATGLSYRASGFLTGMSYGNGATYSAKPNLRGLPARRLDMKGTTVITDELIGYDQDANPVCVRDSSTGNPGSRDFSYDARNRLVRASAPNQGWISAEYQYDSQDNIKMARLGTRQYNYSYTGLNRLAEIGQPGTAPVATNFWLLSCSDYSLLADIDGGTTGGTGTPGNSGGMIAILPGTLNDGLTDEPYSETLSSMGGTGPYTYALTAGTLPQGLSLTGSTISGTPQFQTIKTFTITSTDSLGNTGWQTYELSIELGGGGNEPFMLAEPMLLIGDTLKYAFTHDANGRMTAKGAQAYVYDALNRMTQVTSKESYLYDGHGRRVQVTKTSDGKLNYPIYSLDGKLLLEDNRQTLKRTEYIYAGGRLVAKRIQPITSAGANNGAATTTTVHTDFLGSPVAETNNSGIVTRVERYTPYGEPADMQLDVGPGFTGHATDVLTGLTYMQQRYYDAEIGRTLTPDPVATNPNTGGNFNVYWYADNNPVANVDPDGREAETKAEPKTEIKACGKDTGCRIGSGQSPGTVGGSTVSATTTSGSRAETGSQSNKSDNIGVMSNYTSDPRERFRQQAIDGTKPIEPLCIECALGGAGAARLTYALAAKASPTLAVLIAGEGTESVALAVSIRNSQKDLFRGPLAPFLKGWRQPTFDDLMKHYNGDLSKILYKSGTSNPVQNLNGATGVGIYIIGEHEN